MLDPAGVAIATVSSILITVDIVGNCLVCAIIKKHRDMRTPMNYLLVNLAVADILYAAFIAPDIFLSLTSIHPAGKTGAVLCKLLTGGTVAWIGGAASVITFAAIAIERYYAVVYPLGNKVELTERKLKIIITGSWIFSSVLCTPAFLIRNVRRNVCEITWEGRLSKAYHWMWFVLVVPSLSLMVGFYSRVVYTLWFKRNDGNQLNYQQRAAMKVRKRVTMMVVTVTALFGLCWISDVIVHAIDSFPSYSIDKDVYTVTHTMILFSSSTNPFVYALLNQNFRQKIKRLMFGARSTAVVCPATRENNFTDVSIVTHPTRHKGEPCFMESYAPEQFLPMQLQSTLVLADTLGTGV